jgi:hypothetical protein
MNQSRSGSGGLLQAQVDVEILPTTRAYDSKETLGFSPGSTSFGSHYSALDILRSSPMMKPMARAATKLNNPRVFEEAREAIIKLETLSRVLTPAELETLEILFDKHATALIAKSLQEAEGRTYEPIAKIL